jgi:tetratricopeptide (TPR) repeat protein
VEHVSKQEALDYCLANPDNLSAAQLLARFPAYREELEPLLVLGELLCQAPVPVVPPDRRAAMRRRLLAAADRARTAPPRRAAATDRAPVPPVPNGHYAVQRAKTGTHEPAAPAPFVGRQAELEALRRLIGSTLRATAPAGQVVAITGGPGIGKSRLTGEVLREIRGTLSGVQIATDLCRSDEQTMPYAPIGRLLRQVLRLTPHSSRRAQAMALRRQVGDLLPGWERFAPLLGTLLSLPLRDTRLTGALTGAQRRDRLHDLVIGLCRAAAQRQPLVGVLDDLQWIDPSSHTLIARLAAELADSPILLLLVYRLGTVPAEPWTTLSHCTTMALAPLPRPASAALLGALLQGEPPAELAALIDYGARTPFFLEESVRYLRESGTLQRDRTGDWMCIRPLDRAALPGQVEALIAARLDRMDAATRAVAQMAAVAGQGFTAPLLARALGAEPALAARLDSLVGAAVLVREEPGGPPSYQFRHTMIRDAVYDGMRATQRRDLHGQVAAVIAEAPAADLDDQHALLAQHYQHAGQPDQALPHYLAAAQQAQARYAHAEARALYAQAAVCAPWRDRALVPADLPAALLLYENWGDVLALTGDYAEARDHYTTLLALLAQIALPERAQQQARLQRKIGSTYENQGQLPTALDWLNQAAAGIAAAPPSAAARLEDACVRSDLGWTYWRQGDLAQAQDYLAQALIRAESVGSSDQQARILNRLGGVAWARGDMPMARYYVEQSMVAYRRTGDLVGQANALNNLGVLDERQGRLGDSIRHGRQAILINERLGNRRAMAIGAITVGYALYDRGEYPQARDYLVQALQHAGTVHDTYHRMLALLNLGRVLTALREWDTAAETLRESATIAGQLQLPAEQLDSYVAQGELALQRADLPAALHAAEQGRALTVPAETEELARFQRFQARLAQAQGKSAEAVDLLAAATTLFIRLQNVPEAERTQHLRGQVAGQAAPG